MPMVWNTDADAKLFAAVLTTSDVKIDYAAVAAIMGPDCTAKALTHRITNIKKRAAEQSDVATATARSGATVAAAATPRKRGPAKKLSNTNGTGDEDGESPAKKARTNGGGSKKRSYPAAANGDPSVNGTVKSEPKDDDRGDDGSGEA